MSKEILAVLDKLEERFPNTLPTDTKDIDLSRLVGNQEVVLFIYNYMDQQDRNNKKKA